MTANGTADIAAKARKLAELSGSEAEDLPFARQASGTGWHPTERPPVTRGTVTEQGLEDLVAGFVQHIEDHHVVLSNSLLVDVLAAYLSSQFLLFAGPSGTGKSTVARVLASYFCDASSWAVIEARRQLIGPEEVVGYLSPLSGQFVRLPDLRGLRQLANGGPTSASPALIVEEINLSPVEGYLSPLIHGLSALTSEQVNWVLHDDLEMEDPPADLTLQPFLRLLGTINVDATAMAPAPKVAARACVLLFLNADDPDVGEALEGIMSEGQNQTTHDSLGAPFAGDPHQIFDTPPPNLDFGALLEAVERAIAILGPGPGDPNVVSVSRRQIGQMLSYSAWYAAIAHSAWSLAKIGDRSRYQVAAENALAHFVLPSLSPGDLAAAIRKTDGYAGLALPPSDSEDIGGLLPGVITRFLSGSASPGRILDFWDRLS
jgi:energy-coupling factor transporter ATP-binding protein EcfA2